MKLNYALIRIYNFLLAIIPTIVFYRAIVQAEYEWGLLAISGTGTKGDFMHLVVFMLLAWAAFLLNSWYKRKWYYLIPFILFTTVSSTLTVGLVNQIDIVFKADAIGVVVDLGSWLIGLSWVLWGINLIWTWFDFRRFQSRTIAFNKQSFKWFILIVVIGLGILVLFSLGTGDPHLITDRIGVPLVIVQGLLIAHLSERKSSSQRESKGLSKTIRN